MWDVCAIEKEQLNPKIKVQNRFDILSQGIQKTNLNIGEMAKMKVAGKNQKTRKMEGAEGNRSLRAFGVSQRQEPCLGTTANEARQGPNLMGVSRR